MNQYEVSNFRPTKVNQLQALKITGETWYHDISDFDIREADERSKYILGSIQKLDELNLKALSVVSEMESTAQKWFISLQPIFLCVPYINKKVFAKLLQNRRGAPRNLNLSLFRQGLNSEQDPISYRNMGHLPEDHSEEDELSFRFGVGISSSKILALDSTSALHASLTCSPIYRAPSTGSSVDSVLQYFEPTNYNATKNFRKRASQLSLLGDALASRFDPEFINYLSNRNGAVVSISDLPLEIMKINGVPLFFLFDHCRILETSYGSQLTLFARAAYGATYIINESTISKILVVCLVRKDKSISTHFEAITKTCLSRDDLSSVRFEYADTIGELRDLIENLKPEVLILDTHGKHRPEEFDSVLQVGDQFIDGADIVKYGISAPIVILSACSTTPLQGYLNPIAQAFFEAGSLSVMTSMLPVNITKASILYFRILSNLPSAISGKFHDSWCGFVSHVLRTSVFDEYMFAVAKVAKDKVAEQKFIEVKSNWMKESQIFEKRQECFKTLIDVICGLFTESDQPKIAGKLVQMHITPEAYYYSLLGRADLIKFQ